jgi:hypothetical protein
MGTELTADARSVRHRTPRKSESRFQRSCFRVSWSWGAAPGFYVNATPLTLLTRARKRALQLLSWRPRQCAFAE